MATPNPSCRRYGPISFSNSRSYNKSGTTRVNPAENTVRLVQLIRTEAGRQTEKSLTLNATGAIGAICCEMGFKWSIVRGIGVMARAIGLVGHIMEEMEDPISMEIWSRVDEEAGGPVWSTPAGAT